MNLMTHLGYAAQVEFSADDDCFIGHIAGIADVVGFHADTVAELKTAFKESVEDYLATCAAANREPQRPYSGKIMLRIEPRIHAQIAMYAKAQGKSLNLWTQDLFTKAVAAH